jgi:hypothetical protein
MNNKTMAFDKLRIRLNDEQNYYDSGWNEYDEKTIKAALNDMVQNYSKKFESSTENNKIQKETAYSPLQQNLDINSKSFFFFFSSYITYILMFFLIFKNIHLLLNIIFLV